MGKCGSECINEVGNIVNKIGGDNLSKIKFIEDSYMSIGRNLTYYRQKLIILRNKLIGRLTDANISQRSLSYQVIKMCQISLSDMRRHDKEITTLNGDLNGGHTLKAIQDLVVNSGGRYTYRVSSDIGNGIRIAEIRWIESGQLRRSVKTLFPGTGIAGRFDVDGQEFDDLINLIKDPNSIYAQMKKGSSAFVYGGGQDWYSVPLMFNNIKIEFAYRLSSSNYVSSVIPYVSSQVTQQAIDAFVW